MEHSSITLTLVVAIREHDLANVVRLLAEGANANVIIEEQGNGWDEVSEPVLVMAARAGDTDIVRALVDAGAHMDTQRVYNEYKWPDGWQGAEDVGDALSIAAARGHFDVVELLLQRGAKARGNALAAAAGSNQLHTAATMLSHGIDPGLGTNQPLAAAVRNDHLEMVKLLVESGARIDHAQPGDEFGTPFCTALVLGRVEIARYFIDRGAKPPSRTRFEKIVRYHDREVAEAVLVALGLGVPEPRRRQKKR